MIEKKLNELIQMIKLWIQKEEADGCVGCKYLGNELWEMPCKDCKRNHKDYWRLNDENI